VPRDEDAAGVGDRVDRGVDVRARHPPGGVLHVDVVGGDGRLDVALVQREERRRPGAVTPAPALGHAPAVLVAGRALQLGEALEPERLREAHDRGARRVGAAGQLLAVWKATSSRWSTMYWATSFCEREKSSKRAWM
jgi:hypothetical protein